MPVDIDSNVVTSLRSRLSSRASEIAVEEATVLLATAEADEQSSTVTELAKKTAQGQVMHVVTEKQLKKETAAKTLAAEEKRQLSPKEAVALGEKPLAPQEELSAEMTLGLKQALDESGAQITEDAATVLLQAAQTAEERRSIEKKLEAKARQGKVTTTIVERVETITETVTRCIPGKEDARTAAEIILSQTMQRAEVSKMRPLTVQEFVVLVTKVKERPEEVVDVSASKTLQLKKELKTDVEMTEEHAEALLKSAKTKAEEREISAVLRRKAEKGQIMKTIERKVAPEVVSAAFGRPQAVAAAEQVLYREQYEAEIEAKRKISRQEYVQAMTQVQGVTIEEKSIPAEFTIGLKKALAKDESVVAEEAAELLLREASKEEKASVESQLEKKVAEGKVTKSVQVVILSIK